MSEVVIKMYVYQNFKDAADSLLLNKDPKIEKIFVNKEGVLFPFSFSRKNSSKIVFFFPGAFSSTERKPKFQRSSYFSSLNYNAVSFFDPTLFLCSKMTSGWFQGYGKRSYLELLSELINEIVEYYQFSNENMLFFATSAGGIPAVKMSAQYENSNVYAGNIQVDIFKHYPTKYNLIVDTMMDGKGSVKEYKSVFSDNYHILNLNSKINMYYAQNRCDVYHYKNHYLKFIESLRDDTLLNLEKVEYFDKSSGHLPLSKDIELSIINSILAKKGIEHIFTEYLSE